MYPLAVRCDVETFDFVFFMNAKTDGLPDHCGDNPAYYQRPRRHDDEALNLCAQLLGHGHTFAEPQTPQHLGAEKRRQQNTQCTANAVDGENIEGVVNINFLLYESDAPLTDDPRHDTENQRTCRPDKTGAGGNRG